MLRRHSIYSEYDSSSTDDDDYGETGDYHRCGVAGFSHLYTAINNYHSSNSLQLVVGFQDITFSFRFLKATTTTVATTTSTTTTTQPTTTTTQSKSI